jgi:hypothetical protein
MYIYIYIWNVNVSRNMYNMYIYIILYDKIAYVLVLCVQ